MSESEDVLTQILKGAVTDIMPHKDLVIDAVQDLVKDEIKRYIKQKLEEDPQLKAEIKEAINEYLSAKIKEVNATLKLAKSGAKLGLNLIPENLRAEVSRDIVGLFEKELGIILEKGL
jgi:adenosyl cobinamide kinase/adenosyl cobinamide phosphate guanylyltransferase